MAALDPGAQFWLNWWVQLAVAIATFTVAIVALFGEGSRAKFFPPILELDLPDTSGEKTKAQLRWIENGTLHERTEDARYYHLRARNSRRWSAANQCHVVLLRLEQPAADGAFIAMWSGDVPLTWRQPSSPLRTIGPPALVDLCSVVKDKWLQLHPLVTPNNLETLWREPASLILTVQCRSNERESNALRVRIDWDGKWHDGAAEMRRHLIVKVLDEQIV